MARKLVLWAACPFDGRKLFKANLLEGDVEVQCPICRRTLRVLVGEEIGLTYKVLKEASLKKTS